MKAKILDVRFIRIEEVLLFKIIFQDPKVIKLGSFIFKTSNGITIASVSNPQINGSRFYLKGNNKTPDDNRWNFIRFDDSETCKAKANLLIEAIKELNEKKGIMFT